MVELEFDCDLRNTADASDPPRCKVNRLNFRLNKLYVPKDATHWIDDVAWVKIARGDLVEHRREQNEVLAADQRHFSFGAASKRFVQVHRRAQPCEPASGDHNTSLLHFPITS